MPGASPPTRKAADTATAAALLAAALPRLEAVRADSHADPWNEQAYQDGSALRAKLATAGR